MNFSTPLKDVADAAASHRTERCHSGWSFGESSKPRVEGFAYNCQDYTLYENRFQTFRSWPKTHPIRPATLAGAGFHYTGEGDKVRCTWCKIELRQWEVFDNALEQHKIHSSGECNFLKIYFPRRSLKCNNRDCEALGLTLNPEV